MGSKAIFSLMAVAILIGWFMPSDIAGTRAEVSSLASPESGPPKIKFTPQTQSTVLIMQPATMQATQSDGDAVTLTRAADGHFYTLAAIGDVEVKFLVDTGASMVALTGADALSLGLTWSPDELRTVGRGANGDIQGKPVTLESLSVGGFTAANLQAVIIPDGLDVSLLGQSFLSKIGNVNIKAGQMTFS
jgi:aspartyl protease family protein